MRQRRRLSGNQASDGQSNRSVDRTRSSTRTNAQPTGRLTWQGRNILGVVGLATLSMLAPACAEKFDTSRTIPARNSVGEEIFGVLCDRVGAQALREDLSGDSFRGVCHRPKGGEFADEVDTSKLPPIAEGAVNDKGETVSLEDQRENRGRAVGKVEALGRRRADLIRALDVTFPTDLVPTKDLDNEDPGKTCDNVKKGQAALTEQLADMLGRMGDLYNDGTIPQSTESLAHVIDTFKNSDEAQNAWVRLGARQGYRPIDTALGAIRPVVAYPNLRDFANASLRLLSADSDPYEAEPSRDADGKRIPVPGPGNTAFNKLLEAAHEELLAATVDPRSAPLTTTTDPLTGRIILSRPRDNFELLSSVMFASDPSFGGQADSRYIVKRDARGFAALAGAVSAPFIDGDKDGLPDVDASGRFKTTDGSVPPAPFYFPGAPDTQRDTFGRVLEGGKLVYDYIDTSHTFAAQAMSDLKPLLNADPAAKHETLMDALAGAYVAVGPRTATKKAFGKKTVEYQGIDVEKSPILDLIYAAGIVLSDPNSDTTLGLGKELLATKQAETARAAGALLAAGDVATKHPEAKIDKSATFWDETIDVFVKIAKEPGLLEDLLRAFSDPATSLMGDAFSRYATLRDEISYDRNDINGGVYNVTTNGGGDMTTPVDRTKPTTGKNRSALQRFLGLISDGTGVTACSKADAKVHALGLNVPGSFPECAVYKIDNLSAFFVDSIVDAQSMDPPSTVVKRGTIYMRPAALRLASNAALIEDSSGITGFWPDVTGGTLAPQPKFLARMVFFDQQNDSTNAKANLFISDLNGAWFGSNICPERVIDDPSPSAADAAPDGKIRGLRNCPDGQWFQQRNANTIFTWELNSFYDSLRPMLKAFVKHRREDLFLELANTVYKHWTNADATPDECRFGEGQCPRTGLNGYEPLLGEMLAGDLLPAITEIAKSLDSISVKRCDTTDANGLCTKTTTISGVDAAAAATRAMVDPDYARNTLGLTDRHGNATARRNDGATNPQVTPAYLLTSALRGIDDTFDAYELQNPTDAARRESWKRARSQLVDQFLGVSGARSTSEFKNPALAKMTPVIIDLVRSQLFAHCPRSFSPPYEKCSWASTELVKKAQDVLSGPLAAGGLETLDAIGRDPESRKQTELMLQYLVDTTSRNDALAGVLAYREGVTARARGDVAGDTGGAFRSKATGGPLLERPPQPASIAPSVSTEALRTVRRETEARLRMRWIRSNLGLAGGPG